MKHFALILLVFASLHAQPSTASFEVATVKPSPPNDGNFTRGCNGGPGSKDPGLWRCTNATISMLVMRGYNIKGYQLTAPDWTSNTNYEISAKLAPGATQDQFREMIQNLLTDRFKLKFHQSKKEMEMYDLVAGKGGPKLVESVDQPAGAKDNSPAPGATDAEGYPNISKNCNGCMAINAAGKARYSATKSTTKSLAEMLANQLRMPVSDQTGLTGQYQITISWSSGGGANPLSTADSAADPGLTMESAVQQQLGLRLIRKKGLIDVIVVDSAEKNPADNE